MNLSARDIAESASSITDESSRERFVDKACAGDSALISEVKMILRDDATLAGSLHGIEDPDATVSPHRGSGRAVSAEHSGQVIDHYKLLKPLGEGGFGSVWLAEQSEPVTRRVALKIIKLGMDTKEVIARFEAERQALAMMDHPNIARVFDAGVTSTGRPYFVMELCTGEEISAYCDKRKLSIADRLELMMQICHAVQHAHQKGIIHRDIKPSNVLVDTHDDKPHVKVIDFGIAKATSQSLTMKTLFTESQQLIGTPEYMSPEQADGQLDIDTRTDVYSLGVLLYELLTGSTPFSARDLRSAAFGELQRIIREVDPPRPSTRLSLSAESLSELANRRHTEPGRLSRIIRGDLDWIVMKCLEKDRTRRYSTPSALAEDLQRHLTGEAVSAVPPSAGYRVRKFVRRHRGGVLAASLVAGALVLGIVGTSVGLANANEQRQRAEAEAERAEEQALLARAAEEREKERADELELVANFQAEQLNAVDPPTMGIQIRSDLLDNIRTAALRSGASETEADQRVAQASELLSAADFTGTALHALEENILLPAVEAARTSFADQPLMRAKLIQTTSNNAHRLGLYTFARNIQAEASGLFQSELPADDQAVLDSRQQLALFMRSSGQFEEAETMYRELLSEALRLFGDEHPVTARYMSNLGVHLSDIGQAEESLELERQARDIYTATLGPLHLDTIRSTGNIGAALANLDRPDEAFTEYYAALEGLRKTVGDDDSHTFRQLSNIATLHLKQGDFAAAEEILRESVEGNRRVLGNDHPLTHVSIDNLGNALYRQQKYEEATRYAQEAFEGRQRTLGPNHPDTLRSVYNLGMIYQTQKNDERASEQFRRAAGGFRVAYGEFHPNTITARTNLTGTLFRLSRWAEIETHLFDELHLLETRADAPTDRHESIIRAIGILYRYWDEAEPGNGYDAKSAEWVQRLEDFRAANAEPAS
jgi:serine/threonine protein kinase/tetratricopeptide (TPR) repeat protein